MKYFSVVPLYGRLLVSPTNIRLGWKSLPGTNTLASYKNPYITAVKSFITLAPGVGMGIPILRFDVKILRHDKKCAVGT